MFQRFKQLFGASQSDWPQRARRMMQVCAVALSHIDVSSRGRLVRTESASGNTGYVLQLSLPYPVDGTGVLALQAYLRRNIEAVMGLQLEEREFLLQLQDVSAILPMSAERISTEWLTRRMGDARRASVERVARETAEAEKVRRAKVVPLMRDVDTTSAKQPWPTRLTGSEFMSLEPFAHGEPAAEQPRSGLPSRTFVPAVRASARRMLNKVGLINLDDLARPSEGLFAPTDLFESAHSR